MRIPDDHVSAGHATSRDPYAWLLRFWDDVIARRDGRRWVVATLHDGHTWLRDPLAWSEVRHVLRPRADVDFLHVRAYAIERAEHFPSGTDFLLIGRPKPYTSTRLNSYAHELESNAVAKFHDTARGTPGKIVSYGPNLTFRQHEIESAPEFPPRCDVDFGVLLYREEKIFGEHCRMVAIAGVGQLATALLTRVLTDDVKRARLHGQVAAIAPRPPVAPEEHTEICVRFELEEMRIDDFLNHGRFDFEVEVVAFGKESVYARGAERVLTLAPDQNGERGGWVESDLGRLKLTRERFFFLRRLVEEPGATSTPELCRYLGEVGGTGWRVAHPGRLAKLVHDLNRNLRTISGVDRAVRFSKKPEEQRYMLTGVRATLASTVPDTAGAVPPAARRTPGRRG